MLVGPQKLFFEPTKPVEELYDTDSDPHEIHNLAGDVKYTAELSRLRKAHDQWREETGDLGLVPEAELMERVRPGGKWSLTADPTISISDGKATIACRTEGASIAYRISEPNEGPRETPAAKGKKARGGKDAKNAAAPREHWLLYTGPVEA